MNSLPACPTMWLEPGEKNQLVFERTRSGAQLVTAKQAIQAFARCSTAWLDGLTTPPCQRQSDRRLGRAAFAYSLPGLEVDTSATGGMLQHGAGCVHHDGSCYALDTHPSGCALGMTWQPLASAMFVSSQVCVPFRCKDAKQTQKERRSSNTFHTAVQSGIVPLDLLQHCCWHAKREASDL